MSTSSSTKEEPRRQSCDRCHATKLRCQRFNKESCVRCHRRGVECVYGVRLPRGRPKSLRLETQSTASPTGIEVASDVAHRALPDRRRQLTEQDQDPRVANVPRPKSNSAQVSATSRTGGLGPSYGQESGFHLSADPTDIVAPVSGTKTDKNESNNESYSHSGMSGPRLLPTEAFFDGKDTLQGQARLLESPQFGAWYSKTSQRPDQSDYQPTTGYYTSQTSALRPSYVENGFWAFIHGQETLCDEVIQTVQVSPWLSSSSSLCAAEKARAGFAALLKEELPARPVCDALLQFFLVGVQPIHPILHRPTFQQQYEAFWASHACMIGSDRDHSPWDGLVGDDPTFVPLLFSVLHCGASTAPSSSWPASRPLATTDPAKAIDSLRNSYLKALRYGQDVDAPTTNTLVAFLLGHVSLAPSDETFRGPAFINMVVRMARSMGLHREACFKTGGDDEVRENRRHIWWHILHMDMEASLRCGSQTNCGMEGTHWDVEMTGEPCMANVIPSLAPFVESDAQPHNSFDGSSAFSIFAAGRNSMTRFMHSLLNRVNSCRPLSQDDLNLYLDSFKKIHVQVGALASRLPAQGVPENGFLPLRLANASPTTHRSLYSDQMDRPSVFASWARNALSMMMTNCLICLKRIFLSHPSLKSEQSEKMWTTSFHLSIDVLRHLVQILRVPAFSTYFWAYKVDIFTLQAILMVLSHLQRNPASPDAQTAYYLVDEILQMLGTPETEEEISLDIGGTQKPHKTHASPPQHKHDTSSMNKETWAIWRLFNDMRLNLNSARPPPPGIINDNLYSIAENTKVPPPKEERQHHATTDDNSAWLSLSSPQQSQHTSTSSLSALETAQNHREVNPAGDYTIVSGNHQDLPGFDLWHWSPYVGSEVSSAHGLGREAQSILDAKDVDIWRAFDLSPFE